MSTKQIAVLLDARAGDNGPRWNQIACVGQWSGHSNGPFQLTTDHFREIVANFKATMNRRIPVDFEHASELPATEGTVPTSGAPAQGWIVDLDNRGAGGLWGLIEWLEPARTYIKEGKYKFFSPTIRFNSRDPKTGARGCRLSSGALTNSPFIDGMAPLAASSRAESQEEMPEVPIQAITALADRYVDRLVADGHHPGKAYRLAMVRAGRAIASGLNAQPSETEQLADRVRSSEATITQLADKIAGARGGLDREGAFGEAERMLRAGGAPSPLPGAVRCKGAESSSGESIVQFADRIQAEQGCDREHAFKLAEKQLFG